MLQASVQVNFCQDACVYLAPRPNAMAESPQNLRAVGSPAQAAADASTVTPDSERVRRCLARECEDIAPNTVQESVRIEADECLVGT